jgi:mannose-6-phosphate isomerase
MRLALAFRVDENYAPGNTESQRTFFERLGAALEKRQHSVEIYILQTGSSVIGPTAAEPGSLVSIAEVGELANLFRKANDYDLLHIHGSMSAGFFSGLTDTPVLLSLAPSASVDPCSLLDNCGERTYLVWTEDSDTPDHPRFLGVIRYGSESTAEDYLNVYKKILAMYHREDHRPWGYYQVLSDMENHKVKRIVVYPGKRLSLQRHRKRSEHWVMISGAGLVTLDDQEILVEPGQSVDIPVGVKHRIFNPGAEPAVFVEIQMGAYFGEDDIERFEDDFGRV